MRVSAFLATLALIGCARVMSHHVHYGPPQVLERIPNAPTPTPFRSEPPPPLASVPVGSIAWKKIVYAGDGFAASYVADTSRLYVRRAGAIDAFDMLSNRRIWTHGSNGAPIAASGRALYTFRLADPTGTPSFPGGGTLARLDAADGRMLWVKSVGIGGAVADSAGLLYETQQVDGTASLTAFRPDGSVAWTTRTEGGDRLSIIGSLVLGYAVRDGAMMSGELSSFDRKTGRFYGRQSSFSRLLGFEGTTIAYGQADEFGGDMDVFCCKATLLTVDLRHGAFAGNPASRYLSVRARDLEPDLGTNLQTQEACRYDYRSKYAQAMNASFDRIGHIFAFWTSGSLYAVAARSVLRMTDRGECPEGASNGSAMFAARENSIDVVTSVGTKIVVTPVLPVRRADIVATLATKRWLYVEVGDWLYAVDPVRKSAATRWHVACSQWIELEQLTDRDVLACTGPPNRRFDRLYAFVGS